MAKRSFYSFTEQAARRITDAVRRFDGTAKNSAAMRARRPMPAIAHGIRRGYVQSEVSGGDSTSVLVKGTGEIVENVFLENQGTIADGTFVIFARDLDTGYWVIINADCPEEDESE